MASSKTKRLHSILKKNFNTWWGPGSARPALIFSFLVDGDEELKEPVEEDGKLKFLCKTLLKLLPPKALVIAGKKGGTIDNLFREILIQDLQSKGGKLEDESANLDTGADNDDPYDLSFYDSHRNFSIRTLNWKKNLIPKSFYSTMEDLLVDPEACEYGRRKIHPTEKAFLVKISLEPWNDSEQSRDKLYPTIYPEIEELNADENEYDHKKLCQSIYWPIFRHLAEGPSGRKLCDIICNPWYDEDLSRAILEKISRREFPKFVFESDVEENWIRDCLQIIPEEAPFRGSEGEIDDWAKPLASRKGGYNIKCKVLMMWCVQELISTDVTMIFWRGGKDKLAMALMGYKVSKTLSEKYNLTEAGEGMKQQQCFFETLSIDHLAKCYLTDSQVTFQLLTGRVEELHNVSPVEIAMGSTFESFIAQTPCRLLMDAIWTEPLLDYKRFNYALFVVSMICPLFSPILVGVDETSALYITDIEDSPQNLKREYSIDEQWHISLTRVLKKCTAGNALGQYAISCLDYFWKVRTFLQASLVRYIYGLVAHIIFLIIFSIILLTDFRAKISTLEIVVGAWAVILAIEEIRQVFNEGRGYVNKWNVFDNLALIFCLCGFLVRVVYHFTPAACPTCLYVARIVLAFSLMFFILRSLQLLVIHATLGPKIHMIKQLFGDLVSFMLILSVFVSAYGVVSNAILYPNQPLAVSLLSSVFYDSWWSILGQYTREDVLGLNCAEDLASNITAEYCSSTTDVNIDYVKCKQHKCPANNWIVSIILALYSLVAVIMMLNVLIAMFNNTFSGVEDKKREVFNIQRYLLMREYSVKSVVPVPLCVVTYWRFIPWSIRLCHKKISERGKPPPAITQWTLFRRNASDDLVKMVESKVSREDKSDMAPDAEVGKLTDALTKLTRSQLEFVKQMIFGLSKKTSE